MNCPSRNDETLGHDGWNQSPARLSADLTTRQDLNGIANVRVQREHGSKPGDAEEEVRLTEKHGDIPHQDNTMKGKGGEEVVVDAEKRAADDQKTLGDNNGPPGGLGLFQRYSQRGFQILTKYVKFIGPGFMIAVA
jgi:metal iron transporter